MCTVSYVPLDDGYLLTSNRDENPLRDTIPPQKQKLSNGDYIIAPVDQRKKGTWIATNTRNKTACILNSTGKKELRGLKYRKSRGYYVMEAFTYTTFLDFVEAVDLYHIAPFTLLFIENYTIQVLLWDGEEKLYNTLDPTLPHLWSSSTLYTMKDHYKKEIFFKKELHEKSPNHNDLLRIHGLAKTTPFIINNPDVKTVSITQIIAKKSTITLAYYPK